MWCVLSKALKRQGKSAEARAALAKAPAFYAKENPRDGLAQGDFLRLWAEQGDYDRIWESLSPSLAAAREDAMLPYDLAACALKLAKARIRRRRRDGRRRRPRSGRRGRGNSPRRTGN